MRRWFDGTLSVNEMAAWLFLQASTGWRAATAKDVADRFGWSPPTVRKVLRALVRLKLAKREGRRYSPLSPSAVWASQSEKWLAAIAAESEKIRPTVSPESEKYRPAYLAYGVKEEQKSACAREALATPAEQSAASLAHACAGRETVTEVTPSLALFASSTNHGVAEIRPVEDVAPEKLAAVAAVASDEKLATCIRQVTGSRVADAVLRPLAFTLCASTPRT
jgi:DNA-binding Lrp family transcriptional regulator